MVERNKALTYPGEDYLSPEERTILFGKITSGIIEGVPGSLELARSLAQKAFHGALSDDDLLEAGFLIRAGYQEDREDGQAPPLYSHSDYRAEVETLAADQHP
jgi:hypothetical protein